jgi:hypothetical protein
MISFLSMSDIEAGEGVDNTMNRNGYVNKSEDMDTCPAVGTSINVSKDLFPYCIVWSPLPPITWVLPFIGHMGIADSRG